MIFQGLDITRAALAQSSELPAKLLPLHELDVNESSLVLSLVNIERENVLRNIPAQVKAGGTIVVKEPPVFINAFVMLTSAYPNYSTCIDNLTRGMEFFQNKPYLDKYNYVPANPPWDNGIEKMLFEWHNLDFDKLNQVWGIHGGKYMPSVMYKVRMLMVEKVTTPDQGPAITQIQFGSEII